MAPWLRMRRTRARVSMPASPTMPCSDQVVVQRAGGAKIARHTTVLTHDEASQMWAAALHILLVDAVVANLRVGHRDNLTAITWIGQNLLITGHGSVEDDFAIHLTGGTERCACKYSSVL